MSKISQTKKLAAKRDGNSMTFRLWKNIFFWFCLPKSQPTQFIKYKVNFAAKVSVEQEQVQV